MKSYINAASLAAASIAAAHANPVPLGQSILDPLGAPIADGALLFNSRLRYEYADQEGFDDANAFTLRTRLGYQTGVYSGFSLLAEGEYNWELNSGDFAAYPPPFNAGQTVVADGESFDLNRLFAKYQSEPFTAMVGRQDINLLNQRHVGTVAWRQNDQTFDAARFQLNAIPDFVLDYTYNWQVNRIFGSEAPAGALQRLHGDNHFLNATYTGIGNLTLGAYAYLLYFSNAAAISSDTYGLFAEGTTPLCPSYSLKYRAEWAYQMENSDTTAGTDFSEHYFHVRGAVIRNKYEVGAGFESLGGDGINAFQTPLATLHLFNGWADSFLATPGGGLRDYYVFAGAPLCWGINGRLEAHYFTAEDTGDVYGQEYGISLVKKFNDNLTALTKVSQYAGDASNGGVVGADKTKFWLQLEYTF